MTTMHPCPHCGTPTDNRVHCSHKCYTESRKRVECICEECETIFTRLACELPPKAGGTNLTTNATGRFCSLRCYWDWKVGKSVQA